MKNGGLSSERQAEVKDRLVARKQNLWLEVKQQLKTSIGDGYQEMLATARDEEDQASVSLLAETQLSLLGPNGRSWRPSKQPCKG